MLPTTVVGPSPDWVKVTVPSTPAVPVRTQMAFFSSATTERTAERPAETRLDARGARATLENGIGGGGRMRAWGGEPGQSVANVCRSIREGIETVDVENANVDVDRLARSVGAIASLTDPERRVSGRTVKKRPRGRSVWK